jgi:hypothetical protein
MNIDILSPAPDFRRSVIRSINDTASFRVGSTPSSGTTNSSRFQCYFLDETASRWEFCAAELTLAKFSIRLITAEKS